MEPLLRIGNNDSGQRLDAVLARTYPHYSRSFFQKFLKKGGVTLSGSPREPSYRVRAGEVFQIADFESTCHPREGGDPVSFEAAGFPLTTAGMTATTPNILFEDESL